MKQIIISTDDGDVKVKQTERGLELHIPKNWRGWKVEGFLWKYKDQIDPMRTRIPARLVKKTIERLVKVKQGITFNPWSQLEPTVKFPNNRKGYAVALTHNVKPGNLAKSEKFLREFLQKHAVKLQLPDMYVGIWSFIDKDLKRRFTCIDLVRVISDREDAIETGRLRKQDAIYDLDKDCDIFLVDEPYVLEL